MSQFIIDSSAIALIGQRVSKVMTVLDYATLQMSEKGSFQVYTKCGCGAGGTCANSCVSGCAERGGCGPYGPR